MDKSFQIEVKSVYGNDLVYPANETARKFAQLTGTKTFSHGQLCIIESLGYTITQAVKQFRVAA